MTGPGRGVTLPVGAGCDRSVRPELKSAEVTAAEFSELCAEINRLAINVFEI